MASEVSTRGALPLPSRAKAGLSETGQRCYQCLTYFKLSITVPSVIMGGLTPVLDAFFWIHSRATRALSSQPALSWQAVTDAPPSDVRRSE